MARRRSKSSQRSRSARQLGRRARAQEHAILATELQKKRDIPGVVDMQTIIGGKKRTITVKTGWQASRGRADN